MRKWKITVRFNFKELNYTISKYPTIREECGVARVLFIDEHTGLPKNFPYANVSIEEVIA